MSVWTLDKINPRALWSRILAATLCKAKAREKHSSFSSRNVRIPVVEEARDALNLV